MKVFNLGYGEVGITIGDTPDGDVVLCFDNSPPDEEDVGFVKGGYLGDDSVMITFKDADCIDRLIDTLKELRKQFFEDNNATS